MPISILMTSDINLHRYKRFLNNEADYIYYYPKAPPEILYQPNGTIIYKCFTRHGILHFDDKKRMEKYYQKNGKIKVGDLIYLCHFPCMSPTTADVWLEATEIYMKGMDELTLEEINHLGYANAREFQYSLQRLHCTYVWRDPDINKVARYWRIRFYPGKEPEIIIKDDYYYYHNQIIVIVKTKRIE